MSREAPKKRQRRNSFLYGGRTAFIPVRHGQIHLPHPVFCQDPLSHLWHDARTALRPPSGRSRVSALQRHGDSHGDRRADRLLAEIPALQKSVFFLCCNRVPHQFHLLCPSLDRRIRLTRDAKKQEVYGIRPVRLLLFGAVRHVIPFGIFEFSPQPPPAYPQRTGKHIFPT